MTQPSQSHSRPLRRGFAALAVMLAAGAGALASFGAAADAATASHAAVVSHAPTYTFTTLDNQSDPTFNQLLGINSKGIIAGYFGSGAKGHPNKGYLLDPPYAQSNYVSENYPLSA
jgi:hypothetical protein